MYRKNISAIFPILNKILFVSLFGISIFFSFVELYKYPGFAAKHFTISLNILIILTVISGSLTKVLESNKKVALIDTVYTYTINIAARLFLPIILVSLTAGIIESINYSNFIFSKLHIHPGAFYPLFSLTLLALFLKTSFKTFFKSNQKYKSMLILLIIVIGFSWLYKNLCDDLGYVIYQIKPILKEPGATYDLKMRNRWNNFYDCMQLIKNNTEETASIIIPPGTFPWELEGNDYLVRYFLYPRKIQNVSSNNLNSLKNTEYILFAWGFLNNKERTGGWPNFQVEAVKVTYLNDQSTVSYFDGNYDPNIFDQLRTCGIIKTK